MLEPGLLTNCEGHRFAADSVAVACFAVDMADYLEVDIDVEMI